VLAFGQPRRPFPHAQAKGRRDGRQAVIASTYYL
jgi:hypothetical protein